jgi:DNA-binding transcriptional LysR family regulator
MAIAVAENASFTRASQQLYVAQSAISRKIKMLEDELGEPIFKRVNKKIYVTPAGETLLRYARRIFLDMRNAKLEISEIAHLERGQLRVGAGMLACTYIIPPVLEKFKALHPRIDLEVITAPTDALLSKLNDNLIELGVFTLPIKHSDLQVVPLITEEMVVVTSPKHPVLSLKTKINAEELQDYPLILFPKGARHGGRKRRADQAAGEDRSGHQHHSTALRVGRTGARRAALPEDQEPQTHPAGRACVSQVGVHSQDAIRAHSPVQGNPKRIARGCPILIRGAAPRSNHTVNASI